LIHFYKSFRLARITHTQSWVRQDLAPEEAEEAAEVVEVSHPGAEAEEEAEVGFHPEVAAGEDLEVEPEVVVAEEAVEVVEVAGEAEPRLSSSLTDTRACSSPAARRMPW